MKYKIQLTWIQRHFMRCGWCINTAHIQWLSNDMWINIAHAQVMFSSAAAFRNCLCMSELICLTEEARTEFQGMFL